MSDKNGYYSEEDFEKEFGGSFNETDHDEDPALKRKVKKKKPNQKNIKDGKKPKKKKNLKKTIIIVIICFIVLILTGLALGYSFMMNKLGNINTVKVSAEEWGIHPQVKKDLKDYKNIVLLGIDARKGENPEQTRTDAIIIASIYKKTGEVRLISVYRDSYLDIENDDIHQIDKITHAHAFGGPANTVRALNRNMDLNIDDFIRVDWQTVADVTDSMGGLTLEVKEHELNEINKHIATTNKSLNGDPTLLTSPGKQKLNGIQTVAYSRIRKTDGDTQRAERMRNVINAAFVRAKEMKLSELNNTANVGLSQIKTSMTKSTMLNMILDLGSYSMGKSTGWPYEWEGALINGVSYDVPITLKSNVIKLHEKMFNQKGYVPTDRVLEIDEKIKADSGYYGDEQ